MIAPRHVAVLDVGKSNAKVALVDLDGPSETAVLTRANRVLPGPPWPHFDTAGLWEFFLDGLAAMAGRQKIDAVSVTAHGAALALIGADGGLAAPVLDYEHQGIAEAAAEYRAMRPDFAVTGSPPLAGGLNAGAQLFWQFRTDPGLQARVSQIVTYPQYWSYLLTGQLATDVTSLGCHTDLWEPRARRFSALVDRLGIRTKLAPPRLPGDVLGTVLPDIAARTGIDPATPVACGIHDSNASLLPHLLTRRPPFAVVSTGTWVVVLAVGGAGLQPGEGRDCLLNVDAMGRPVASARFMGGREFAILVPAPGAAIAKAERQGVLAEGLMLLPSVEPGTGPFPGRMAQWLPAEPARGSAAREVAAGHYLALMTAECLALTGAAGPVVVEGPFSRNADFLAMLASACGREVTASQGATGTSIGAALLFAGQVAMTPPGGRVFQPRDELAFHAADWRKRLD